MALICLAHFVRKVWRYEREDKTEWKTNSPHNTTQKKTNDWTTWSPLKRDMVSSSCSSYGTVHVTFYDMKIMLDTSIYK